MVVSREGAGEHVLLELLSLHSLSLGVSFPSEALLSQLIVSLVLHFLKNFGRCLNYLLPVSSKR